MKKRLIIFSLLASMLFSQETSDTKMSLGFDFHLLPYIMVPEFSSGYSYYDEDINLIDFLGVYFSIEQNDLIIEPSFSYLKETLENDYNSLVSDENDYTYTRTFTNYSVGLFKIFEGIDTRTYVGARIGKSIALLESDANGYEDIELDNFMIAPTFGAEYFVGENFTFGGEVIYKIVTQKDSQSSIYYDIKSTTSMLVPKFLVRFYF